MYLGEGGRFGELEKLMWETTMSPKARTTQGRRTGNRQGREREHSPEGTGGKIWLCGLLSALKLPIIWGHHQYCSIDRVRGQKGAAPL